MTPRATLVIPTRDRVAILAQSLAHYVTQTAPRDAYEIVVVDDASSDGTPALLAAMAASHGIRSLRLDRRSGAAVGRNRAIAIARGEIMIFLDDDGFVAPDFVEAHLRAHERDTRAVVAGGIIEVREPGIPPERPPAWRTYHRHPMPGGNSSVRRAHVIDAGGYDERFDSYGWQDQELAERLLASGLRRRFAWRAPIFHYKPGAVVLDARHELERELLRGRSGARFYHTHRTALVGITTKMWPPIRALDRVLDRAFSLERRSREILAGAPYGAFRGLDAALLRAHVEIGAGLRELRRIERDEPRGEREPHGVAS
jgi:glycosyltransferase involved in cell wall biosynthesis